MTEEVKEILKEDKGAKNTWLVVVLIIVAVISSVWGIYMHIVYYPSELNKTQNNSNITAAYQYGVVTTVEAIVDKTNDCQVVTLQTAQYNRTVADIECFARMLQERNITLN